MIRTISPIRIGNIVFKVWPSVIAFKRLYSTGFSYTDINNPHLFILKICPIIIKKIDSKKIFTSIIKAPYICLTP